MFTPSNTERGMIPDFPRNEEAFANMKMQGDQVAPQTHHIRVNDYSTAGVKRLACACLFRPSAEKPERTKEVTVFAGKRA